ncbi:O-antigen ligase family protein [Candidatus Margulisiibacteriota bacterium]
MHKVKANRLFDIAFLTLFFILIVGIPLVFTSLTRSVFEVNKLLLLRLVIIFTYSLWIFKYFLFKDNKAENGEDNNKNYFTVGSFKWKKVGIEIPLAIWFAINILSTIFSQNIRISIIGAYDRWEGIITITNYIFLIFMWSKLVRARFQIPWLAAGLIVPTVLSSIYGIYQSTGHDFMRWSVDPTMRVFACINNPVHFCAYVSMIIPVCISLLLYLSSKHYRMKKIPKIMVIIKWLVFFATCLIYYAQFLSFSRATWMGFIGSMTLFYLITTNSLNSKNNKAFIIDFFASIIGIAAFYLLYIFRLYLMPPLIHLPIMVVIALYIVHSCYISFKKADSNYVLSLSDIFKASGIVMFLLLTFILNLANINIALGLVTFSLLIPIFIVLTFSLKGGLRFFAARLVIIIIFAQLQFVSISLTSVFLYIILLIGYYFLILRGNPELLREKKFWLLAFLCIFAVVITIPTMPYYFNKTFKLNTQGLQAVKNVDHRVNSYKRDAIKGTARTSMWKSSLPWIKDYWVLGTGPDTIKYMYPKYRRSEYGILEGGHNFTPDRLHNEYLNTLATRGVFGFMVYYFGFIISWYLIVLNGWLNLKNSPYRYLVIGCMCGASIYLGQVLFNFGVVATVVLFYILMGLSLAFVKHSAFYPEDSSEVTKT